MTISRNQPLTPSALAREASDGMSQRDTYIPTIEVINGMRQELRACNEDPMSTQTNRISERPYSIREAPVNQKHAARFLNMHPKTVLRKAREGSLPAHPVGSELSGKWIVEMPEFISRRSERERKAFLTARADYYRAPYERRPRQILRSCVFAASSNDATPLTDETGGQCSNRASGDTANRNKRHRLKLSALSGTQNLSDLNP